jgi:hypothetical protein
MQNYTNLKAKCPATFFEMDNSIEPFSSNSFMMYSATPQTIWISCKGGFNQQHIAVKSHQELKVGKGCKVSTNKYEFESGFNISIDDEIQRWPTIWNLSDVLFDTNADTLHNVIRQLEMIDSRPLPIRDIKKIIWMNNHNKMNFGISITMAVISVVIVIFVTFIIYL